MNYQEDWMIRQIEAIMKFIIGMILGRKKDLTTIEDLKSYNLQTNDLYKRLHILILEKKICDAENMLYSAIDNNEQDIDEIAILFYYEINSLSDAELEEYNFSRDEILSGVKKICQIYGVPEEIFNE